MGWTVKYQRAVVIAIFLILLLPSITHAHDQKEYNILITEDGLQPPSVNPGILVETDTLFFRNVDNRENVTHRILVDADQDGSFEGIDDFNTSWISSSCELNETNEKVNPECEQQALILLDPSNRLLPGNISMIHEIKETDKNTNIESTSSVNFYINFAPDIHEANENLPTGNVDSEEIYEESNREKALELIMFISILGVFFVGIELIKSKED
tara:strand:- start:4482 stop:5120 length:639 start_codon:yes stop_codon:yes gene_type:complete